MERRFLELLDSFIVLEGLDGAGTTTQAGLLAQRLRGTGHPVWETSEPTMGPVGRLIRRVLSGEVVITPESLAMLYAADRHHHLYEPEEGIIARTRSDWVVCDRYLFSSLAYQSVQCDYGLVYDLNRRFPLPRHLVFVEVAPEETEERRKGRSTADIFENLGFQRSVYQLYHRALEEFSDTDMIIHMVDGSGSPQHISEQVWKELEIEPIN
jgi:dTMP kinase